MRINLYNLQSTFLMPTFHEMVICGGKKEHISKVEVINNIVNDRSRQTLTKFCQLNNYKKN